MKTSSPPAEIVNETPVLHNELEVIVEVHLLETWQRAPRLPSTKNIVVCIRNMLTRDFDFILNLTYFAATPLIFNIIYLVAPCL